MGATYLTSILQTISARDALPLRDVETTFYEALTELAPQAQGDDDMACLLSKRFNVNINGGHINGYRMRYGIDPFVPRTKAGQVAELSTRVTELEEKMHHQSSVLRALVRRLNMETEVNGDS